jgi:protein O-GlcNAc transferase
MAKTLVEKMREAFDRFQAQDLSGAERLCVEILRDSPRYPDALHLLGVVRLATGNAGEAVSLISGALEGKPSDPVVLEHLGLACVSQKDYAAAEAAFQQAIARGGRQGVRFNLGNLYASMGRLEDAASTFQQLLAIEPNDADASNNLGIVHQRQGRRDEARASYLRALEANPRHAHAWHNLGTVYSEQGDFKNAAAAYQKSLQIAPTQAHVHNDLGNALRDGGDFEGAIAAYRKSIAIDPQSVAALYDLAETFKVKGGLEEAAACYERALASEPRHPQALSGLVHARQHMCSWDGFEALWSRLRAEINSASDGQISPFSVLSLPTTPQEQLACAVSWSRRNMDPIAATRPALGFDFSRSRRRDRLRVGYLAWGLHDHATGNWAPQLFELHDRSRWEVTAYAYGPDDGSPIRARIRGAAERFVDLAREPDVAAARRIYEDGVDILVDLTGYTFGTRSRILALRPAPVQVNWFYPGTMGTSCADYFIADPFVVPPELEPFFMERIARLPDCYMITDRKRPVSEVVPTRAECGIPDSAFVFCYFNQTYKILPDTFASWMRILRDVPGSILWFLESNRWATANLGKEAAKHGVAAERIVVAPRKPMADHLVRYRIADLALDSFPYTSHTTAADALWVGCPLVTRVGGTFASRVAGSALISGGVPELVTETVEACERLAVELANSPARLRAIRQRLEATRATSRLFDTPRFIRNLESAYDDMLEALRDRGPMYNPSE